MIKPLSRTVRLTYLFGLTILFIVLIPVVIFYATGYRVNSGLGIFKTGGILVQNQFSDTDVVLNGVLMKTTNIFQKSIFLDNLKPSSYSLEIKKAGYQPWHQNLTVSAEKISQTSAFILPDTFEIEEITSKVTATTTPEIVGTDGKINQKAQTTVSVNPEYAVVKKLFVINPKTATTTRVFQKVHIDHDKEYLVVFWAGSEADTPYNMCYVDKCVQTVTIKIPNIKSLDFFQGRNDVVIIAEQDKIYTRQIDVRNTPPDQQIYKGKAPEFRLDGEDMYILDVGKYYKIKF